MAYTTVDKASSFFNPRKYSGTGSSNAITGVGFQPDLSWLKITTTDNYKHELFDAVRGVTKYISSDQNTAETTDANSLTAFGADGFTVGTQNEINQSSRDFVSWNWKAGTTSGIGGSPSITPTSYSFNATSRFSIIKWTGTGANATLPHGLGVAPNMIIVKNLDGLNRSWRVYHSTLGATKYLYLAETNNAATDSTIWNDTEPTSTLFSVGTNNETNESGDNIIAYCFADTQGFSKFGYYIGNGTNTYSNRRVGPFIYTGFKPSFVIIKQADGSGTNGWYMFDNKRAGYNPDNEDLLANTTAYEDTTNNFLELESNGFKIRTSGGNMNTFTSKYIYMAFGQALVGSNGVVGTAR